MSLATHKKPRSTKQLVYKNTHTHHLVANNLPNSLPDRFRRCRTNRQSSDASPAPDSGSLHSDAALEFVQGNKEPPIQKIRDQYKANHNDEQGYDGEEENEISDEEVLENPEVDDSDEDPENEAASISFGALAKAQDIYSKRKWSRGVDNDAESLEYSKRSKSTTDNVDLEALERKAGKNDIRDFSRTSKHAPTEISSKKAVSRKRSVVPAKKINHRDPRFEPLSGAIDEQKLKKKYSFLDDYRDSEMADLRASIRKTKDLEAKEKLKRALLTMESRKKAQERKDQEQEVLKRHRKEEKEKIERGKKPFYLKKADQKKLALVERFEGMKGKQVDKVIERRRRKQSTKERKAMPDERRG